jgi:WD40 repeat protein
MAVMITLAALALFAPFTQDPPKTSVSLEEKLLGTIPEDVIPREVWFSPDGRKVLCSAQKGSKMFVIVGDSKGEEYDEVKHPSFAPDHKTVVYEACKGGKSFIVFGDKIEGSKYDGVDFYLFARDGALVYAATVGEKTALVSGREQGEGFESLSWPRVGNEIAYRGSANKRDALMVGGRRVAEYDKIDDLSFSPDEKTLAYAAREKGESFIVMGDQKGPSFDSVRDPVFSSDGKRMAYVASSWKLNKDFVVLGLDQGQKFDWIKDVIFSPDGKSLAYSAVDGNRSYIVLDGKKGPEFDKVRYLRFSPNSSVFAYAAESEGRHFMVVGEQKGDAPGYAACGIPVFSPDGKTVAYKAILDNSKRSVVVGNRRSEEYTEIRNVTFSPDGKSVAFGAVRGRELWWKVMRLE